MTDAVVILVVVAPLLAYLWAGFKVRGAREDLDRYFNARQGITPAEFAGSSTAYNLQVASLTFFIAFGFLAPLAAFVNAVLWGAGILLLYPALPRLMTHFGSRDTLFGFLGKRYGSPVLRSFSSIVCIFTFTGLLLVELVWGTSVLAAFAPDETFIYLVTFTFGFFILGYFIHGGHVSVVRTDQIQLIFSYAGLAVAILWLFFWRTPENSPDAGAGVLVLAAFGFAAYFGSALSVLREKRSPIGVQDKSNVPYVLAGVIAICAVCFLVTALLHVTQLRAVPAAIRQAQPLACPFQWWELLSLLSLPIFWQFVDFNMWQRLGAVRLPASEQGELDLRPIRSGLRRFAIESPITIVVAATIGVALRFTIDSYDDASVWTVLYSLPSTMLDGSIAGATASALLSVAVLAIMLSTADSALVTSVSAFVYDAWPTTRRIVDSAERSPRGQAKVLRVGQTFGIVLVLVGLAGHFVLTSLGVDLVGLLFGAFGVQVAVAPVAIGAVFLKSRVPNSRWAVASIVVGFLVGFAAMAASFIDPAWQYLSPLAALTGAGVIYLFGVMMSPGTAGN